MIFFGAACLVMAVVAFSTDTHLGASRYPLWLLFLLLGSIATLGGTAAVFTDDDEEEFLVDALAEGRLVAVPREELDGLRQVAARYELLTGIRPADRAGSTATPPARRPAQPTPRAEEGGMRMRPPTHPARPPWEELETDREAPDFPEPEGRPNLGAVPDEVEELLAELEAARSGPLGHSASRDGLPERGLETEAAPKVQDAAQDFEAALRRMERSLPESAPDPDDLWLDRAHLPQEFSRLLGELYPPERDRPAVPDAPAATATPQRVGGRCGNCGGRLTSAVTECSVCHMALCRTCEGLARLTSERPVCDRCEAKASVGLSR